VGSPKWDANTAREELRLLIDSDACLQPIVLHLGLWTLAEAIARSMREAGHQAIAQGGSDHLANALMGTGEVAAMRQTVEPLVALLLYLQPGCRNR